MLNGKLLSIVKSQSLERRGVLYEVTIKHSPKSKRRQHGKGLGKKFEFRAPFEIHCNCIAFNSMCKPILCYLWVKKEFFIKVTISEDPSTKGFYSNYYFCKCP